MIGEPGRADAGAFLARLVRLDPASLARLRPVRHGLVQLWAMLPFNVLVERTLASRASGDMTFGAQDLLAALADPGADVPPRRDAAWRWPLPPSRGQVIERLPVTDVARLAIAASRTLRAATGFNGRAVGERFMRDALLGHVAIVVRGPADQRVEVPQRLIQGVVRMGFLGQLPDPPTDINITESELTVTVRIAGHWIGLAAPYGSAWYRPSSPLRLA